MLDMYITRLLYYLLCRADIEGADFTDAMLRKDVQKDLCKKAKGTNPITGEETKTSLVCF